MGKQVTTGTHEEFLHRVRAAVIDRALDAGRITTEEAERLQHTKLVYGVGDGRYRGVCHYGAWENGIGTVAVIEVAASGEESWVQLAGTTMHELGHVLAGWGAGHSTDWKEAATRLGLRVPMAAGQVYRPAQFDPTIRQKAAAIASQIADGTPAFRTVARNISAGTGYVNVTPRPCTAGHGTKGGKSRGTGSGSRMLKVECSICGYVARLTRTWLDKGAPYCGADFAHGRLVEEEK